MSHEDSDWPAVSEPAVPAGEAEGLPHLDGYEILGKLSDRGGQGTVWEAVQLGTSRKVALKFLRAGALGSRAAQVRFEREVELTASLGHPNIARVYDSGLHQGVYYYAMELIEGIALDEYVQQNGLAQREILALVRIICQAVQHAHQRGIIHRDLKPSNILVTADGQPRVLDFGLAKTSREQAGGPTASLDGEVAGTPAYMSPEQAAGRPDQTDTRSDVYSLGVILYELLTGRLPHDMGGTRYELLRRIAEEDILRPRDLSRTVDRELESLLLKSLAHDPADRYVSAGELAADLDNYLRAEPLTARRPTTVYFLRKRMRKYRLPIAVAAAILAVLVGMAVWSYVRVRDERDQSEAARLGEQSARLRELAQREIAEGQRRQAEKALYQSRLSEARALRLTREQGWSHLAFENLRLNARMTIPERSVVELRGEVVACMERLDAHEVACLAQHTAPVWSVEFSPDGTMLAAAGYDGKLLVWSVEERRVVREVAEEGASILKRHKPEAPIPVLRFHPGGSYLAYSTWRHAVGFLSLKQGAGPFPRLTSTAQVADIAFDDTGDVMAVSWTDGRVTVCDSTTGRTVRAIQSGARGGAGEIPVALTPDGALLAALGSDTIELHPLTAEGEAVHLGGLRPATVSCLRFSPHGRLLACASHDGTVRVLDVRDGSERTRLVGHRARVHRLAFGCNGNVIATASDDGTARLWDGGTGECLVVLRPRVGPVLSAAFSADENHLAVAGAGGQVFLYRLANQFARRVLRGHGYAVDGLAFQPHLAVLFSGSADKDIIRWQLPSGRVLRRWQGYQDKAVTKLAVSPRGDLIAAGNGSFGNARSADHAVRVWEADTGKLRQAFAGHGADVSCVSFDPTGTLVASADQNGLTAVWKASSGQAVRTWSDGPDQVRGLAFLAGGPRLLTASRNGAILVRGIADGKTVRASAIGGKLSSLAVSSDESLVAVGSDDGHFRVLTLPALAIRKAVGKAHEGAVNAVAFGPDGQLLATGGSDGYVTLWGLPAFERLLSLPRHTASIYDLVFHPRAPLLAVCGVEEQVTVWNMAAIRNRLASVGVGWGVAAGTTATDDGRAAWECRVAGPSEELRPLSESAHRMEALGEYRQAESAYRAALKRSPNSAPAHADLARFLSAYPDPQRHEAGEALRLARRAVELGPREGSGWAAQGMAQYRLGNWPAALEAFGTAAELGEMRRGDLFLLAMARWQSGAQATARGEFLHAVDWMERSALGDEGALRIRREAAGLLGLPSRFAKHRATLRGHAADARSVAFSPDGKTLATGSFDATARLWDVATGQWRATLSGHSQPDGSQPGLARGVNSVAFSPQGKLLATGGLDGAIILWEVATGRKVWTLRRHPGRVFSVAFSPDGSRLASVGGDAPVVKLWDVATGAELATLEGHRLGLECVVFAPDGRTLASTGWDETLRTWRTETWRESATFAVGDQHLSISFAPDGRTLATGGPGETVKIRDARTGADRATLHGTGIYLRTVAFSPDGRMLASGSLAVNLWDVATGCLLARLEGHPVGIWAVAFAPDGRTLASAGRDGSVRIWDVIRPEGAPIRPTSQETQRASSPSQP